MALRFTTSVSYGFMLWLKPAADRFS
jgi:hypothetical protein